MAQIGAIKTNRITVSKKLLQLAHSIIKVAIATVKQTTVNKAVANEAVKSFLKSISILGFYHK